MNKIKYFLAAFALVLVSASRSIAAPPPPVQIYYLPVPETDSRTFYRSINGSISATTNMQLIVSIVTGAANAVITIDNWEDGYEADIANPTQATTLIYGDGDLTNGVAPGFPTDIIPRGATLSISTTINPDTRATVFDLDGQDKIATSVPIALTMLTWPTDTGTVAADSTELLSTLSWGTDFTIPVDHTDSTNSKPFTDMAVEIMAEQDGTVVQIDGIGATADGTPDATQVINQGETFFYSDPTPTNDRTTSLSDNLFKGAKIHSNKPVQVIFLNGQTGSAYETRWNYLYADNLLSNNYYNPVNTTGTVGVNDGSDAPTAVFIHNINNSAITITWIDSDGTTTNSANTVVAAHATAQFNIPDHFGSRFFSVGGEKFTAIGVVDTDALSTARDWGLTLIPEGQLRHQGIVGLGLGRDPTSASGPTDNVSPIFLMATHPSSAPSASAITVCVDYNGDGAGPLTDSNGLKYDVQFVLNPLQTVKIYDPDGDQSGMFLYVCDGSDGIIATAWGQHRFGLDSTHLACDINGTYAGCLEASQGAPSIDAGNAVPGFPSAVASKSFTLLNDLDGDGFVDIGDTVTYSIKVDQTGNLPVPAGAFTVFDTLPAEVSYVPGTTHFINTSNVTSSIPDDGSGTPFPIDGLGVPLPTTIGIGESVFFTFNVVVNSIPAGNQPIINTASISGSEQFSTVNNLFVPGSIGDRIFYDANHNGSWDAGEGIVGVTLTLQDNLGNTIATTTTGADGSYLFNGLLPNTYKVIIDATNFNSGNPLNSYATQIDPDAGTANQVTVPLNMAENNLAVDYAYMPVGTITGTIFKDLDNGSDIDAGEGTAGVTVELLDSGNNVIAFTSTNGSGVYTFNNVEVGSYIVRVASSSFNSGQPLENFANTYDPDGGFDDKLAATVLLGATTSGIDLGYQSTANLGSISGNIFNDLNSSGGTDSGEGVNAVLVELLVGQTVVDTTTTDSSGNYSFTNLAAGSYTVRVASSNFNSGQPLENFNNTVDPDNTLDSQTDETLNTAQTITGVDFGYHATVTPTPTPPAGQCTDLKPVQFALDGAAFTLSKEVNVAIRIRGRLANTHTCSAVSSKQGTTLRRQANGLYTQAWQTIYSLPQTDFTQCQSGINCTLFDATGGKATYKNLTDQTAAISKNLVNASCPKKKGGKPRANLLAAIAALQAEIQTQLANFPDHPLVCS
jgi:uncharacterized repeat protein (TIGR01451 family)